MVSKVLFVDDEPSMTDALRRSLRGEPYDILTAQSAADALEIIRTEQVDVVVSDERMPLTSGSELLAAVREESPDTVRIILTGHASLESAIRAINAGEVYRFLTKPCRELDLALTIRQALEHRQLLKELMRLRREVKAKRAMLEELERMQPGITKVETDASGAVIINDPEAD